MLKINLYEKDSIAVLEPNDKLQEIDFITAKRIIDPYITKNGNLKGIIIYVREFPFWDSFSSFLSHLKFVNEHHEKVSHIAFVTDSLIGSFGENIASHFIKAKIKNFDYEQLEKAKSWIIDDDYVTHGLFFSCKTNQNNVFIKFKAIGVLSHNDYENFSPIIDSALEKLINPKVNILIDIERLEGWELEAAWDDLKLAFKHGNKFNKIAIYGHKKWQDIASKIGAWFISGEVKTFEDINEASAWLNEE